MTLSEFIRYWIHSLPYPTLRRLGFPAMGLGIDGKVNWRARGARILVHNEC